MANTGAPAGAAATVRQRRRIRPATRRPVRSGPVPTGVLASVFITPATAALLADLSENLTGVRPPTAFAWLASANGVAGSLAYRTGGVLVTNTGLWATIAVAATLPALGMQGVGGDDCRGEVK